MNPQERISVRVKSGLAALTLLLSGGAALAQSVVTLTAAPSTILLPDGQTVPMWGYACGPILTSGSSVPVPTCTNANGSPQSAGAWQPPVIRMSGTSLSIRLNNALNFTPATPAAATANGIPTSLVIVGQVGGGLGSKPITVPSPAHAPQGTTWPGSLGATDSGLSAITVNTPGSGYKAGSAVTIAGGGGSGATASIAAVDKNGGIVSIAVTAAGSGYSYAAGPITFSFATPGSGAAATASLVGSADAPTFTPPKQADRVRSFATEVAAGGSATLTWNNLRPGTYLLESGTQPSIQGPMGLYGVLVVSEPDAGTPPAHTAYGQAFDADMVMLLSEIDPVQNTAVDQAVNTAGFSDKLVWNGQPTQCGEVTVHTCYPPAVNYSPLYYLVNGASFDRTNFTPMNGPAAATQGKLLLRLVNAGLHMHVPSVVGSSLSLIAEDGNKLPGTPKVQNEVFLAAGKTYDVTIQPLQTTPGTYDPATLALFDRALGLSTGGSGRDGGMQVYINVNGGAPAGDVATPAQLSVAAKAYSCIAGVNLTITDPAKGLLGGATGANGVALNAAAPGSLNASIALQPNGTFTYSQATGATTCGGTFTYTVNGTKPLTASISQCDAKSQSSDCKLNTVSAANIAFTSNVATRFVSAPPGVLGANIVNPGGLALTAAITGIPAGGSVVLNSDGSFVTDSSGGVACPAFANAPVGANCATFNFTAQDAQGSVSPQATAAVIFLPPSGLTVNVYDAPLAKNGATNAAKINDYRWIIEEDKTFWVDPKCQINTTDARISSYNNEACPPLPVESPGYNFHTSHMDVIAQGCVGAVSCESGQMQGSDAVACDVGNGICRTGVTQKTEVPPSAVHLDPKKHYFISVLPGDSVNPTIGGSGGPQTINGKTVPFDIARDCGPFTLSDPRWVPGDAQALCGHEMGGSQIAPYQSAVNINLQETPLPTAKLSVFVFQDDNPLNGENDAGGGVDVLAPNEPGLGGFEIKLFDQAGGLGDNTGQITYDMFNQPVSNSLANHIDPITGLDACPITARGDGLLGMIPTCPTYESDGKTLSPLAGQVVVANLYAGLYEVQAYPAADRIGRGEEWLQTNTLDGGKPHEAFLKPNEPGYFQEFGPGGFHVAIGFANRKIINDRKAGVCGAPQPADYCSHTLNVHVSNTHMSRTPDQRTYSSGSYDHYAFTNCYVSVGPADAQDFELEKCDADGNATFANMPNGTFKISVFDQWNDIMLDGLVGTVVVNGDTTKEFPATQWRTNLYTRTFIDTDGSGASTDAKPGLALVNTNIRYRDGSYGFYNNTDLNGYAAFNEVFPFMNWLVVETTSTRFKPTSAHTVYDAGGVVDTTTTDSHGVTTSTGGGSKIADHLANTQERFSLPGTLKVPGARYCGNADCAPGDTSGGSSGVVVPAQPWGLTQAWQGLLGQNSFMEFGMTPFQPGENGGINGHVIYASTRPFDDPARLLQLQWEPGVPRVKINLYQETTDANGNTQLKLVDTTQTTSWDDWAQGFRAPGVPNMNCPGQDAASPFFATLKGSKQWLDPNKNPLPADGLYKCYDGWSQLNQIQPAPYDGMYKFPSVNVDGATGKFTQANCSICTNNKVDGSPMLPAGKYVVEVVVPPGYELVKEEDKNILLGDVYIAPVTQQFAGFGNVYIMPDQAAVASHYNGNNPGNLNLTTDLGDTLHHEGDTGSIEAFWPCVGAKRTVPAFNSLFPGAGQAAPFAGAQRNLCDRKEVVLTDQSSVLAKFYVFSSAHIAGHFTGTITNDFASEFDPFSPQFGEKFGPPNLPVALRDFNGDEVARVYSDQWGIYNGLYFSTWSVNPPNPTGYAPQMSIACMNDPGPILDPSSGKMVTDPAYNPAYSNFCYEQPFMPGFTTYMDTPVIPTQAFADNYNLPDAEYPDNTPAIASVKGDSIGPWVASAGGGNTVSGITLGSGGSGYTSAPNVIINGGGGSGASAVAALTPSGVGTLSISNRGSGYSAPTTVSFTGGGGGGATASAYLGVVSVAIVGNGGRGSFAGNAMPTVTFDAPSCTPLNSTTCVRATGTAQMSNFGGRHVSGVTIAQRGAGYLTAPAVTFSTGTASANSSLGVTYLHLVNAGNGYASAPSLSFAGGGTGAAATALLAPTSVASVTVTSGGAGYTAAPTVAFNGGAGSGASATAQLSPSGTITIASLGSKVVQNPAFSGPNSTVAPFNQKTITRTYNFGSSAGKAVLVDGNGTEHALGNVSWSDTLITGTVPGDLPPCAVQQRNASGGTARCGELVITRADNGKRSIDTVTVTVGGSAPWVVTPAGVTAPGGRTVADYGAAFGRMGPSPIQVALDSAAPGDLVIVAPGTYRENLIMWKPVRLQGVGAASVTVNADAHPAGKMDQWRRQVTCVFGLSTEGVPNLNDAQFDPTGTYTCPGTMHQRADRIPFEAVIGWDTAGNGNLAQVLQEPTLMGAYEGAGITVLGRGVRIPAGSTDFWGQLATGGAGAFTDGSVYLQNRDQDCARSGSSNGRDYGTSNYYCNPSRVDGISIVNSSQGGGAVFIHGWAHNLEVANTRIQGNHGTLAGGINLGNGETPDAYVNDGVECGVNLTGANAVTPCPPIPDGTVLNAAIPFQFNTKVRLHHNMIYDNASIGDALFSGTPAGAGAITVSAGADDYQIDHNWIAGNLSTGDGGGLQHLGLSFRGKINNNYVLFNQSTNPTLPTNGGGIVIEGANLDRMVNGQECGSTSDVDCPPGLGEGAGKSLVLDANLIVGNSAESGSGGGLRLQQLNGSETVAFPRRSDQWYDVAVTNNIIVNNVAGWDGGGVSMQDTLMASLINNTIASNDTTATAGSLFKTLGAVNAASAPPGCTSDPTQEQNLNCPSTDAPHSPQPAGLVVMAHTPNLLEAIGTLTVNCPANGFGYSAQGDCRKLSKPRLVNNLFWQNRAFSVDLAGMGTGNQSQQQLIAITPLLNQGSTGACSTAPGGGGSLPANFFWDIGLRTDDVAAGAISAAANKLSISNSIYSGVDPQGAITTDGSDLTPSASPVVAQYCNGARMPPEHCSDAGIDQNNPVCMGYNAPPGASETTSLTQVFTFKGIQPTATVDEGHNWLNLSYGPLSLGRPNTPVGTATAAELMVASGTAGTVGGAYSLPNTSPAVSRGSGAVISGNLTHDFFGNARSSGGRVDIGAVECQGSACVGSGNGGGGGQPTFPTLGVLDNFNRNATNLGNNWRQAVLLGIAQIRDNGTVATGPTLFNNGATAYWSATADFGQKQAAQITLSGNNVNNEGVLLKASGAITGGYQNFVRVRYTNGTVVVDHTNNGGMTYSGAVTLNSGTLTAGNLLTALVDGTGTVYVWKTVGTTSTLVGQAAAAATGTGAIGLYLQQNGQADNFAGGAVP